MKTTNPPASDAELLEQFRAGNRNALGILFKRYEKFLFSITFQKVRNAEKTRDILQDTYMKAVLSLNAGRYADSGSFKYWLARIASNSLMDTYRAKKRGFDTLPLPESEDDESIYTAWINSIRTDILSPERILIESESKAWLKMWLKAGIRELPPEQRLVLLLRYNFEMSFKEIAKVTEVSINTALGRVRYALINLRKKEAVAA